MGLLFMSGSGRDLATKGSPYWKRRSVSAPRSASHPSCGPGDDGLHCLRAPKLV